MSQAIAPRRQRTRTLVLGLLRVDKVEPAGLDLAVDERTREAGAALPVRQPSVARGQRGTTYRISFALAWLSGSPFSATWFS